MNAEELGKHFGHKLSISPMYDRNKKIGGRLFCDTCEIFLSGRIDND